MTRSSRIILGMVVALLPLPGLAQVDDMPPLPAESSLYQDWVLEILKYTPIFAGILGAILCLIIHLRVSRRLALTWSGGAPSGGSFWITPAVVAILSYIAVCAVVLVPGWVSDPVFKNHVRQNFGGWNTAYWFALLLLALSPMILRYIFPAKSAR